LAQAQRKVEQTSAVQRHLHRWLREGALIALVAVSVFLLLSLYSYDSEDPGWTYTGSTEQVSNLVGTIGAWCADVLLTLFGFFALLFPIILLYRAWLVFRSSADLIPFNWTVFLLRMMGMLITIAAGTGLAGLHFYSAASSLPNGSGGILGNVINDALVPALSFVGSTLLLLPCLLFGITIFTNLSWLGLMEGTGRLVILLMDHTYSNWHRFSKWRQNRSEIKRTTQDRREALEEQAVKEQQRTPIKIEPAPPKPQPSQRVEREKQGNLFKMPSVNGLPALGLLDSGEGDEKHGYSPEDLSALSRLLELKLKDYGIDAEVVAVYPGPVITRFEIQPAAGVKVSRISGLVKDLARSLAVISVRVVEVIAGKSVVGIEIPNADRQLVRLSEVLTSPVYDNAHSPLSLVLGQDISGQPIVVDLARMPHLLVAGTTGSGKSVGLNAMVLSILYKASPEDVRMIMVDPKMLELSVYAGIPHLLTPVVTDMKDAANALRWCVAEMERRYRLMAALGVRNIGGFNRKVREAEKVGMPLKDPLFVAEQGLTGDGEEEAADLEKLPFVLVVIDEFADMMMIVGKKVEELIARLAQKARAAGIHLILATQRPSVDVITGLIKANIPTRIAFQVSSRVDSRTILDQGGAEQLLGNGDMLYMPAGSPLPIRVHGAYVDDDEVHRVAQSWRELGNANYIEGILDVRQDADVLPTALTADGEAGDEQDQLYDEAVRFVTESRRASISSVQRRLRIGYNRAARMIESMEQAGVVSEMNSNGSREVLVAAPPVD
tara:strand:+ start:1415 stop:3748 length:2334 start_codon:yes stop_codon:yes gene_type:complete